MDLSQSQSKFNIFLSYDNKNKEKVIELREYLKSEGLTVWMDKEQMPNGFINDLLYAGVRNSDLFLCCLTENYPQRDNCKLELNLAHAYGKKILTVFFDNQNMSYSDILKKYEGVGFFFAGKIIYKITDINKLKNGIISALKDLVTLK
jgi:hypothetical protein